MRHWRLLLISILFIAILTTSSLAAIVQEMQCSNLFADQTPQGDITGWTADYQFNKFDPSKGKLLSVELNTSLNCSVFARVENWGPSWCNGSYAYVDADLDMEMIEGSPLHLDLIVNGSKHNVPPSDGILDFQGNSSFNDTAVGNITDSRTTSNVSAYVGQGTFNLTAVNKAVSTVRGCGTFALHIETRGWSYACITYTYDNTHCLSGYKKDGCTGLLLSGWNITISNATSQWNATTDASGFWQVCNLENDTYSVCELSQDGWTQTYPDGCYTRDLAGENITNLNFTNQASLCISGHKKNTCGGFNLSNWTIVLTNSLGGAISALTNETGYYQFCSLPPGIYNLSEESKEGWSPVSAPEQVTLNCSNISGMDFVNSECCGSSLKINKTADFGPSPVNPAGINQAINYTIIVENTGNETLYQVNVTDDKLGLREQIASLLPGEFKIFNARYVVAEIDLCGNITNIVWANATDPCNKTFHLNARWSVPTSYTAAIEIDKRADVSSARIGDVINYTYTVKNTGDVNLSGLKIEDDRLGMIDERV